MISFETAKRLKEAGFPQPDPSLWQQWYYHQYPDGTAAKWVPVFIGEAHSHPTQLLVIVQNGALIDYFTKTLIEKGLLIFAPTAIDILRETSGATIEYGEGQYTATSRVDFSMHSDPGEAIAALWLFSHKEKPSHVGS